MSKIQIATEHAAGSGEPRNRAKAMEYMVDVKMPDISPTVEIETYNRDFMQQFINAARLNDVAVFDLDYPPQGKNTIRGIVLGYNIVYSWGGEEVKYDCTIRIKK
jgi:hypothetical protein